MIAPDDICEKYSSKKINLNIFIKSGTVFIEGDQITLKFLSELIKAQSDFKKDDGFQISPSGAGKIFFKDKKGYGIYIHKLDNPQ